VINKRIKGGENMKNEEKNLNKKLPYVEPKVLATYEKEELEEVIKTQGNFNEVSPIIAAN
jgi:hypothetical protein